MNKKMILVLVSIGCFFIGSAIAVKYPHYPHSEHALDGALLYQWLAEAKLDGISPNNINPNYYIDGRENAKQDIRLAETITVSIGKTYVTQTYVITLTDIDGNKTTIWTDGTDLSKDMRVTQVTPN